MKLVSSKNFIIFLAAILVIAFGVMSLYLDKKKSPTGNVPEGIMQPEPTLTQTNEIEDIETDLDTTDLEKMDEELESIDMELENL